MGAMTVVARAGVTRGLIELRQSFAGAELIAQLLWPVVTLVAIFFLRDNSIGTSGFTVGALMLPGTLGMFVAFGMLLVIQQLTADREDGTLLRAKATPHGIRAYLVGKIVTVSGSILVYLTILLGAGLLLVDGLDVAHARAWLTLGWVLLLGLVATVAVGAVLGALVPSPRSAGPISALVMGLAAISGIFYPITALQGWLQAIAQVFPMYWLALGMRAALLPPAAAAVEVGGSWRTLETAAVLGAWALAGLLAAPPVLARMARRESGSSMAERREKKLQRVG